MVVIRSMKSNQMRLGDAVKIKSAEFWLELGQPVQALLELQDLPGSASRHPWAIQVLRRAFQLAGNACSDAVELRARLSRAE
jgi:hypothetical protein